MPDALSATFAALADPTRRAILARLCTGECSVTELADPFDMSLPAVSKHLRVLERAGLVAQRKQAQWRHCRIEAAPLKAIVDWAEHYRHIWEGRFDRLDQYLTDLPAHSGGTRIRGKAPAAARQTSPSKVHSKEQRHGRKKRRQQR
jgi:DNA-binding transcriptional ArsR family regulator